MFLAHLYITYIPIPEFSIKKERAAASHPTSVMSASSSPPPYSPRASPLSPSQDPKTTTASLRHLTIILLAYAYDVDFDLLRKAISSSPLPLSPTAHASVLLLSEQDVAYLLQLADVITKCGKLVHLNRISLLTDSQRAFLVENIIAPAIALDIENPARIMHHIRYFPRHRLDPRMRRQSCIYEGYSWLWGCKKGIPRDNLAKWLAVDDLFVEKLAPSEEVRLLIGDAVARFRGKYETYLNKGKRVERIWWGPAQDVALVEELVQRKAVEDARR